MYEYLYVFIFILYIITCIYFNMYYINIGVHLPSLHLQDTIRRSFDTLQYFFCFIFYIPEETSFTF